MCLRYVRFVIIRIDWMFILAKSQFVTSNILNYEMYVLQSLFYFSYISSDIATAAVLCSALLSRILRVQHFRSVSSDLKLLPQLQF